MMMMVVVVVVVVMVLFAIIRNCHIVEHDQR